MDIRVNNYNQSFGMAFINKSNKLPEKVADKFTKALENVATDVIYDGKKVIVKADKDIEVLPHKPYYGYLSGKKEIHFPINVNGQESVYSIKYPTSQNHINKAGQIFFLNGVDRQLASAAEIAKDVAQKTITVV